jgi:CDP-4-dehydro-6-deoxyglucose reductase
MSRSQPWDELRYEVMSKQLITPVITELWLRPRIEVMAYRPGQYVLLCDADYAVAQRSYSVANAPRNDGSVRLLVTYVPGGATSPWVQDDLRVGDDVVLAGPYGTFIANPTATSPMLLLAGGSGLAPVRALAEATVTNQPGRPLTLFFSARTAADVIDRACLEGWADAQAAFRYLLTLTRDSTGPLHGRIPALLPALLSDLNAHEIFVSGPPGFVTGCAAAARLCGADPVRLHTEPFFVDPQPWLGHPPGPVVAEGSTKR